MAREILMLHREISYGVADLDTGAPRSGAYLYIRLAGDNAFAVDDRPVVWKTPYGGGWDAPADDGTDRHEVVGALRTELYPSQAAMLLGWAITRIPSGRDAPWVTTDSAGVMPPGDLASMSAYHAFETDTGALKRTRYSGMKVARWRLECSGESPKWMLTLDLIGQKPVGNEYESSTDPQPTEFPLPVETDYPIGPYSWLDSAGGLTVGSLRSRFTSIAIQGENRLDAQHFESRFLTLCRLLGRTCTVEAALQIRNASTDKAGLRERTAKAVSLVLNNGSKTTTFALESNNRIDSLERNLPLASTYMHNLTAKTFWDRTASKDISVTVADNET